jgi:G3E family GTPase
MCGAAHVSHDPNVSTVTLRLEEPINLKGFRYWMDSLLWESAAVMDLFRIKGLLNVRGSNLKHGVQVSSPRPCLPCVACHALQVCNAWQAMC